ncbi:MAG: sigma-70 family RNA polymerase sigma factor [Bacteroidia bacterium]|nr:sigma-70 family RNA polymerase sigma factor [Bacteroidia bacterium]
MLNDENLVRKCLDNDAKALEQLYRQFSAKMFGICLRYTKNKMEAEDLLHDGFVRVLSNLKEFRFEGSFEGWLRRIMVTTAINYYRKDLTIHMGESDLQTALNVTESGENIYSYLSSRELLAYVQALPDGYRLVFNLYAIEGYKHNEIADLLGISENTSKSQLSKARRALQERIYADKYQTIYGKNKIETAND